MPLACKLQPLFSSPLRLLTVSPKLLTVSPKLLTVPSKPATFWFVAYNWLPFTACLDVELSSASFTLLILVAAPSLPARFKPLSLEVILVALSPLPIVTLFVAFTLFTSISDAKP